jgi:hypothetical protein
MMLLMNWVDNNAAPVDGLHVAEGGILLNPHAALQDVGEAVEADGFHFLHLVDGQGVVLDKFVSADDGQSTRKRRISKHWNILIGKSPVLA